MINYIQNGNLFDSKLEAIVNTVNELGIMGKGIALEFKQKFPDSSAVYMRDAKKGRVKVGKCLVTFDATDSFPHFYYVHFPTKKDWRNKSELSWITDGLKDLALVIDRHKIKSIAIPALGCGNGGLNWSDVKKEIDAHLGNLLDVQIDVYEPI